MEAINNLASTAAKTIWGEGNNAQEPVSGERGDVSKGEPYDAGNMEPKDQANLDGDKAAATTTNASTINPSTTATDTTPADTTAADTRTDPTRTTTTESTDHATKDTEPKDTGVKDSVTDGPTSDKPKDVTGPGPRSLDTVAKEHGGDAGNEAKGESKPASSDAPKDAGEENKNEGTGEQYVKTTGLQADGGDFDATKPGAGMEADRLMEEKGMHREDKKGGPSPLKESTSPSSGKDKPSLTERIKNKLHKH